MSTAKTCTSKSGTATVGTAKNSNLLCLLAEYVGTVRASALRGLPFQLRVDPEPRQLELVRQLLSFTCARPGSLEAGRPQI